MSGKSKSNSFHTMSFGNKLKFDSNFTGIGLETARDLASRGAKVILACRNISKGSSALQDIQQTTGNKKLAVKKLDLSSMESVRQFAGDIIQNEKRYGNRRKCVQ